MTLLLCEDALCCDEAGLWFVRLGDRIIRTQVQPVFRVERGLARATHLFLRGAASPVSSDPGCEAKSNVTPSVIEATCRIADLRNSDRLDGALPVIIDFYVGTDVDDRSLISQFRILAEERSLLRHSRPLLCGLSGTDGLAVERLVEIARLARDHGIGLALVEPVAGFPSVEIVLAIQPDLLQIPAEWLTRVTSAPPAARFLKPLFRSLRQTGTRILIQDVGSRKQALAALAADPDFMMGDYFGAAIPVSAKLDLDVDRSGDLVAPIDEKVIDLSLRRLHRAR